MKEFYDFWNDRYQQQRINNILNRKKKYISEKQKKITFYSIHGGDLFKSKSKSLDVIIEELYLSGIHENIEVQNLEKSERSARSFIPRIKLTTNLNNFETENLVFQMSATQHFQNSSHQGGEDQIDKDHKNLDSFSSHKKNLENKSVNGHIVYVEKKTIFPENNQILELEHTVIQPANDNNKTNKFLGIRLECDEKFSSNTNVSVDSEKFNFEQPDGETAVKLEKQRDENSAINQSISEWYNDLKQHFEKTQVSEDYKSKEMTCRITGATLKKSKESLEDTEKDTKHYFTRLVKNNRALIDEELPDPDKVKNIRAMFQENSNSTLKKKLYQALGGSLQNISTKAVDEHFVRPMSAQSNRDDIICDIIGNKAIKKKIEIRSSNTPITETPKDLMNEFMNENVKKKLLVKYEKDLGTTREFRNKKLLQAKWTDSGSISSGVSSDLSSYDTDVENFSKDETEAEPEDVISDDDYFDENKDKHFVENEFLEKIRSFGTTVTYYGGEMINCSVGPILSPTAIAIMNEISEKYGHKGNITKSFAAFYRKYVEINEPHTMKKLGKSKSFGRNDVFQKPNIMNNNEIELYKNDLETEIGIRKPLGISSNALKRNISKSESKECQKDNNKCDKTGALEESPPSVIDSCTEAKVINDSNSFIEHKKISIEAAKSKPQEQENNAQLSDLTQINPHNENMVKEFNETQMKMPFSKVELEDNYVTQEIDKTKKLNKETTLDCFETTPKEILFGYEKNLLKNKRQSDMEFEEFEVCKNIEEKIEKSRIINKENSNDSEKFLQKVTPVNPNIEIIITQEPSQLIESQNNEENITLIEIQPESKAVTAELVPSKKCTISLNEKERTPIQNNKAVELNNEIEKNLEEKKEQNFQKNDCETVESKIIADYGKKNTKNYRNKHSRWPIETTVVVDIQKETENTPKIITNGKISSKPRKRIF